VYLWILDLMRSQVVGTLGVIHVMFTLFCRVFGRFGKNDLTKDLILRDAGGGGLAKCVCHQDDLMLSSCLSYDLNPDLGRNTWSVSEKSASIFSRTSRDRAVGACCTEQELQRIDSVVPL
jgi:hypothetical protein